MKKIKKTDDEWKSMLTEEQFKVCRQKGTEPDFKNKYFDCKDKGIYVCCCCGNELFSSDSKFDSGTGWPSYWGPIAKDGIVEHEDRSFFMKRTEVACSVCDAHLGHVFPDGPPPTKMRYCINSASLDLKKQA